MPTFDTPEYQQRIHKTKTRMQDAGIEVLLLSDPANMNYLSGYDGWSFYVHQMLVVALDVEEPIWIGRGQDIGGARLTTFVQEENLLGYPDDYVHSTIKHPMEYVAEVLTRNGWHTGIIGVEMDSYYFTAASYAVLVRHLTEATFQDATGLANWVRIIKSAKEIEYIRQAAQIVEKAMEVAIERIEPGVRQCDVVADIYHAQIRGTEAFGGDYPSIVPLLPTGKGTSTPHLTWTDEPFRSGEGAIIEIAGCRLRYHCPLARTLHLGHPDPKVDDVAKAVVDGIGAALDSARPGATGEQVEDAWRREFSKSGFVKESRIGYSMGLNYPPDWGERTISLRPGDKTVLEPNMTLHLIPGIWTEAVGIDISESILITENGCETLTNIPRQLFVKT